MPTDYSRVEAEIERGRLWRAKEILIGHLADASYDPELFRRLATVLANMHDDDEAGRFHFLSGASTGPQAELARNFLDRRTALSLNELWQTMPKAARRRAPQTLIPAGTIDHLRATSKLTDKSQLPIEVSDWPATRRRQRRPSGSRPRKWTDVIAWGLVAILGMALVLGLVEIGRLITRAFSNLI